MQLYTDRKISNVATAENLKGLTSPKKKTYDNTFQKYKDNIQSSRKQNPLKERMAESKKKKKKPKKNLVCRFCPLYILEWQSEREWD